MLGKGLKVFGTEEPPVCKAEIKQMHDQRCFKSIAVAELTRQESVRSQEGLILLTRKISDSVKGRLVYNRKATRDWISKENTSSPNVGTDSIMMTCAVDAYGRRDIMTSAVPNAFIQKDAPEKGIGERVVMTIQGNWWIG